MFRKISLPKLAGNLHRAKAQLGLDSDFDGARLTRDALPAVRQSCLAAPGQSAYTGMRKTLS
jgi:hypothetical protein